MKDKLFIFLLEKIASEASDRGMTVKNVDDAPDTMPACSNPECMAILMPTHFFMDTRESAFMLCHEMAHLMNHDIRERYADELAQYRYERSANILGLYVLLYNYMDVYHDHVNDDEDIIRIMDFLHLPYRLHYYVYKIIDNYKHGYRDTPLTQIERLYIQYKAHQITVVEFEQKKHSTLMCI